MKPQVPVDRSESRVSVASLKPEDIPKDLNHQFSKMLHESIYPQLQVALLKICEKMADDGEVRKYLETTLEQRVLDQDEKRQIESKLLREQYGSPSMIQATSTPNQTTMKMTTEMPGE